MNKIFKKIFVVTLVAFAFVFLLSIITPKVSATEMNLNSVLDIQSNNNKNLYSEVYLYLDSLDNYNVDIIDYLYSKGLNSSDQKYYIEKNQRMISLIRQNKAVVDLTVFTNKENRYKVGFLVSFNNEFFQEDRTETKYLVVIPKNSDVVEEQYSYFWSAGNFSAHSIPNNRDYRNTFLEDEVLFKDLIRNNLENGSILKNTEYIVYGKTIITNKDGIEIEVVRTNGYNVIFKDNVYAEENPNPENEENNLNAIYNLDSWYFANYTNIHFSDEKNDSLVSSGIESPISIRDKPIYLNLIYEAKLPDSISELQSMVIVSSADKSDSFVLYPILNKDNTNCEQNLNEDNKLRNCKFQYQVPIYRSFKKGVEYNFNYIVFPTTDKEIISQEEAKYAEGKLVVSDRIKVHFGDTPFNGRVDMYNKYKQANNPINANTIGKQLNSNYDSKIVIVDNVSDNSVASNNSVNNENNFSSQNETNTRIVVDADITQLSNDVINSKKRYAKSTILPVDDSKLTVIDSKNNSKDVYIQSKNQTRKLKDISEVLKESRLSVDNISSDISIVDVDGVTSYVFRTTEKRKLFGIIPIGEKTVYNVLDAVEDIKE